MTSPRTPSKFTPINYIDLAVGLGAISIIVGWVFGWTKHRPSDDQVFIPFMFYVAIRATTELIKSLKN